MPVLLLIPLAMSAANVWFSSYGESPLVALYFLVLLVLATAGFVLVASPYARHRSRAAQAAAPPEPIAAEDASGAVTLIAPGERRPAVSWRLTELDGTVLVGAATFGISLLGVMIGPLSPSLALVLLGLAAVWVLYWAPAAPRNFTLQNSIVIACDPATVFAFVSDLRNEPRYFYMYEETVEKIGDAPIGAGTKFHAHLILRAGQNPLRKADRTVDAVEEIVDFEPNRRVTTHVEARNPNLTTITLEAVTGGTLVTHRYDHVHSYTSCLLGSRLRGRPVNRYMKANRHAAWARAKEILEGRQAVTP